MKESRTTSNSIICSSAATSSASSAPLRAINPSTPTTAGRNGFFTFNLSDVSEEISQPQTPAPPTESHAITSSPSSAETSPAMPAENNDNHRQTPPRVFIIRYL